MCVQCSPVHVIAGRADDKHPNSPKLLHSIC
jgi:hypothetical protein